MSKHYKSAEELKRRIADVVVGRHLLSATRSRDAQRSASKAVGRAAERAAETATREIAEQMKTQERRAVRDRARAIVAAGIQEGENRVARRMRLAAVGLDMRERIEGHAERQRQEQGEQRLEQLSDIERRRLVWAGRPVPPTKAQRSREAELQRKRSVWAGKPAIRL